MPRAPEKSPHPLYRKYLQADAEVQGHVHASLGYQPNSKKHRARIMGKLVELQEEREEIRAEYDRLFPQVERSHKERMILAANGHPDLKSTQAARNICSKRGYVWSND